MQRDTCPCGFVGHELAQLEESPGVPLVAMCPSNRCSLADSRQILKSECLAGYGSLLHQGLADAVIHVLLEAAFPPRVLPEAAFRVLRVDLLQPLAARVIAVAGLLHRRAAEGLALVVSGKIDNSQINTQHTAVWPRRFWRFAALRDMQVVDTAPPHQISSTNFPPRIDQHLMLASTQKQPADDAPLQRIERYPVKTHQAVGARVVADAATWPKVRARLAVLRL